ncbi:MAG: DUF3857 domain-containing protein [Candidatus Krumholzibacteriota bacterium]
MKALKIITLMVVVSLFAGQSLAAEMGISSGHDLDELWGRAQADYDLSGEDAVLLLESRHVTWDGESTLVTRVHRVVWIGTSVGIRGYADLRIPWNTATSELEVEVLRTWRDGRWWPDESVISETAVVPTLPHALNTADDYTTMRETMLLHDGVELPCIMETVYTITEAGLPGAGGLFVMPQRDPSVRTEFKLTVQVASNPKFEILNADEIPSYHDGPGSVVSWRLENVPALRTPLSGSPAAYEPAIVWSTWSDWPGLRDHWRGLFDEAAVLDAALTDSLQTWIEDAPSPWSRIQAVVDQVNYNVRGVHYSDSFWTYQPRPAVRTWATAYGHPLDRAVLTAALLRSAGYEVTPIFVGSGNRLVGEEVPRLSGLGDLHLSIKGDPAGLYDPDRGTLSGQAPLIGLPLWRTDQYVEPFLGNSTWPHRLEITVTLEPGEDGFWKGTGQFQGSGVFCPQGDMAGMDDGARDYLNGVIGAVLPGATLNRVNPEIFHQHQVILGFGLEAEKPEAESSGRTRLVVGTPAHGLMSRAAGVHLYDESRSSPVMLPAAMEQWVKIRIKIDEAGETDLPAVLSLVNEAGEFTVNTTEKGGWITVERELKLSSDSYPAGMWPQLRALLLEDADPVHGTILLD